MPAARRAYPLLIMAASGDSDRHGEASYGASVIGGLSSNMHRQAGILKHIGPRQLI